MLAQLTSAPSGANKDPLTVAARRRAVQQGFMESFLKKCSKINYKLTRDPNGLDLQDLSDEDIPEDYRGGLSVSGAHSHAGFDNLQNKQNAEINLNDAKFDDVERLESTNQFFEDTFMLAANVSELTENHYALVTPQSQMLPQLLKLAHAFLDLVAEDKTDIPVNMLEFDYGNLRVAKFMA